LILRLNSGLSLPNQKNEEQRHDGADFLFHFINVPLK
jgi:hypothetical protein